MEVVQAIRRFKHARSKIIQTSKSKRMRRDSAADSNRKKSSANNASKGYKMRQLDRYVKWCINTKGYIRYKELIDQLEIVEHVKLQTASVCCT